MYLWGRHPATVGINNLLMLLSVYMFAASGMKTALARRMRHPMLAAVKVWALAHLLVNGDLASLILFGGLLAWAVVEMIAINRAEPHWEPPEPAPLRKEVIALGGSLVVYLLIAWVHYLLGYPVFG
ncbi:MAG: NnrU family protein, partial [Pseudomonadota bacterium]